MVHGMLVSAHRALSNTISALAEIENGFVNELRKWTSLIFRQR